MNEEKFLLVTNDETLPDYINNVFQELNKKFEIITVNSINEAIERIISNGFTFTILDIRTLDVKQDVLSEIIKLNYFARKKLIVLSQKSVVKKLENILPKSMYDCMVVNTFGSHIKEQIQYNYVNGFFNRELDTHKEMTTDIINEIKEIKSSRLYKFLGYLSLIF